MAMYYILGPGDNIFSIFEVFESDGTMARSLTYRADPIQLQSGESLLDALRRQPAKSGHGLPDAQVRQVECPRQFGEFYPRIYRPIWRDSLPKKRVPRDEQTLVSSLIQLTTLTERLTQICRTVSPEGSNLSAYGHEIRNLLLLACTEVEAQWKGVLKANNAVPTQRYFTTKDYVKLLEPLKLAEYTIALPMYPPLSLLSPFASWTPEEPSKSLPWYDAYNAVKHDRETEFPKAQLRYAIDAVVACAVLLQAQYGLIPTWHDHLGEFFQVEKKPQWSEYEMYLAPNRTPEWKETAYKF